MNISYIDLGVGGKRPVCFSLAAAEEFEKEFGSLTDMNEALVNGKAAAINKILDIMFRAGTIYCNEVGMECPPPLKCRPADLIDVRDKTIVSQIFAALSQDSERTVEVKSKN